MVVVVCYLFVVVGCLSFGVLVFVVVRCRSLLFVVHCCLFFSLYICCWLFVVDVCCSFGDGGCVLFVVGC